MAQLAPSPFRDSTTRLQWSSQGLLGCSRLSLPCKSALAKAAPPSRTAGVARASFLDEILRSEVSKEAAGRNGQPLKGAEKTEGMTCKPGTPTPASKRGYPERGEQKNVQKRADFM